MENNSGTRNIRISNFKRMHFCCCSLSRWWWKKKRKFFYALLLLQKWSKNLFSAIYMSIKWDIVKKHHISAILYVLVVTQPHHDSGWQLSFFNIPDPSLENKIPSKNDCWNLRNSPSAFLWLRNNSPNAYTH